jgi:two-component system chemotaxis response regulator CheB
MSTLSFGGRVDAVVIGASAGGIEALGVLLPALPAQSAIPIFVVLHLPRNRPSLLQSIFAAKCPRPTRDAEDKLPVEPGTVYFAPPDYHLLIDDGPCLALSVDEPVNYSRPSIDVLFESAAECYGPRLAAILLTGANHDGAAGLARVRRGGGVTLAQDPADAQVSTMVESAIAIEAAEYVMPLSQIAAALRTLDARPA